MSEEQLPTPEQPDASETPVEADAHEEMTFTQHLEELRDRLVRCIVAVLVGTVVCYAFAGDLFNKLMEPLIEVLQPTGGSLIYTGVAEAFYTEMKVAIVAGLFLVSPYVFYQLWMFIAPGLYESERKYTIPVAICSALFFVSGSLFGYYVVFPAGFHFFMGYASEYVKPMPSLNEYFSFSMTMLFSFGIIFELPLFIFFLARMGIVNHVMLRKYRKYAVLANFIIAAILTPTPDAISQGLMAGPLCLLYEVGIWVAYLFGKRPKKEQAETEAVQQESVES